MLCNLDIRLVWPATRMQCVDMALCLRLHGAWHAFKKICRHASWLSSICIDLLLRSCVCYAPAAVRIIIWVCVLLESMFKRPGQHGYIQMYALKCQLLCIPKTHVHVCYMTAHRGMYIYTSSTSTDVHIVFFLVIRNPPSPRLTR